MHIINLTVILMSTKGDNLLLKILCIDYGDRFIGFAESDVSGLFAVAAGSARCKSMREAIDVSAKKARDTGADTILIGLPYNMDGTEGERASKTRAFGAVLERVAEMKVIYQDERLSTERADERLALSGVKPQNRKRYVDAVSAELILQDYLDEQNDTKRKKKNKT